MNQIENMIRIIDKYIETGDMSEEDYNTLEYNISGFALCLGRNIKKDKEEGRLLSSGDMVNELLLYLSTDKSKYDTSYTTFQKKKYINFVIQKCIQNISREYLTLIDKDRIIGKNRYGLSDDASIYTGPQHETLYDMSNSATVYNIISSLGELSVKEKDIFKQYFLKGLSQEQVAEGLGISQQRLSKYIQKIKNKINEEYKIAENGIINIEHLS